jgi:hypothetical protein
MRTTPLVLRVIELEISRFPCKELPYMPGSQTTRGQTDTRHSVSTHVAFHETYRVGTPEIITYAAQWLACTLPCRRFADILTDNCARLGVDADSYSFIATDFHRPLFAGLPAHKSLILRWKERDFEPSTPALWAGRSQCWHTKKKQCLVAKKHSASTLSSSMTVSLT